MTIRRTPELTWPRTDDSRPDRVEFGQGAGVTIAVIDDAIDTRHPEFTGRVDTGYDVSTGGNSTLPDGWQPHGTKVAGLALAGGIKVRGVAPHARLLPVRVPSLAKRTTIGREDDAIRWAAEHGADVICCAWAPETPTIDGGRLPERTRAAIDWALDHGRYGKGCVIVFAAGNSGSDIALNGYASHPGVIAVGACNYCCRRPSYSGWGVALCCVVLSNDPRDRIGARMTYTTTTPLGSFLLGETLYTNDFGFTSAACAIAAGMCARILSANLDRTWVQVRDLIARSCHRIDPDGGLYDERGHSPYYGFGRLDPTSHI
jgi:subtilisin family serine protease